MLSFVVQKPLMFIYLLSNSLRWFLSQMNYRRRHNCRLKFQVLVVEHSLWRFKLTNAAKLVFLCRMSQHKTEIKEYFFSKAGRSLLYTRLPLQNCRDTIKFHFIKYNLDFQCIAKAWTHINNTGGYNRLSNMIASTEKNLLLTHGKLLNCRSRETEGLGCHSQAHAPSVLLLCVLSLLGSILWLRPRRGTCHSCHIHRPTWFLLCIPTLQGGSFGNSLCLCHEEEKETSLIVAEVSAAACKNALYILDINWVALMWALKMPPLWPWNTRDTCSEGKCGPFSLRGIFGIH